MERGRVVSESDSDSGGPGFCELTVSKYLSGVPLDKLSAFFTINKPLFFSYLFFKWTI